MATRFSEHDFGKFVIRQIRPLGDNFYYIVRDNDSGMTTVVDPGDGRTVLGALKEWGWKLDYIWSTHHHHDHTGGNLTLQQNTKCQVLGAEEGKGRIPGITETCTEGDTVKLGSIQAHVFSVPGHTRDHIAYFIPEGPALFCGDTMFSGGCGKLFEGTPQQMHQSLSKFAQLPPETLCFCGHEYTQSNINFAVKVNPKNSDLQAYAKEVAAKTAKDEWIVPSTIDLELRVNPFMRPHDPEIQNMVAPGVKDPNLADILGRVRSAKDRGYV